jgi:hypothetical protein
MMVVDILKKDDMTVYNGGREIALQIQVELSFI